MTNKELEKLVKELESKIEALQIKPIELPKEVVEEKNVLDLELLNEMPVPLEYRNIVNTTLNSEFGIFIGYNENGMDFNILVPEKYSTLTPEQKKQMKVDRRRKIIAQHEGSNGVQQYAELVFKNFNPTYQAMIVADRN